MEDRQWTQGKHTVRRTALSDATNNVQVSHSPHRVANMVSPGDRSPRAIERDLSDMITEK